MAWPPPKAKPPPVINQTRQDHKERAQAGVAWALAAYNGFRRGLVAHQSYESGYTLHYKDFL